MTKLQAESIYKPVAQVSSRTNPAKKYTVARHRETGTLTCNCMSWATGGICPICLKKAEPIAGDIAHARCTHGHGTVDRACKHIRGYLNDLKLTNGSPYATIEPPITAPTFVAPKPKPAPSHLTPAGASPLLAALIASAVQVGVRGLVPDAKWARVAAELETRLPAVAPKPAAVALDDDEPVRVIVLED